MTLNLHVLFELVLVSAGLGALWGFSRVSDGSRRWWMLGTATMVVAAAVGAARYAGLPVVDLHGQLTSLALTLGVVALFAGAFESLHAPLRAGAVLVLGANAAVALVIDATLLLMGLAIAGIVAVSLNRLDEHPRAARRILAGVGAVVSGELLALLVPSQGTFAAMDVRHVALAVALVLFSRGALAAARPGRSERDGADEAA